MTGRTARPRIGTRGSRLALAQTRIVAEALEPILGATEVVEIATEGDVISAREPTAGWAVADGQFTRALEGALLSGRVDLVVHSYKDLPTASVDGLVVAAVPERADPRDCLITRGGGLADLPHGARVGTSSPRRAKQLLALRPDVVPVPLRGNVETRLRRLASGQYDALILAAAGLDRLGIDVPEASRLPFELMLPAPAQGALAVQARSGDEDLRAALISLDHRETRVAVEAERAMLRRIGGGCLAPVGTLAAVETVDLRLTVAFEATGGSFARASAAGDVTDVGAVVDAVARQMVQAQAAT